MVNEFGPWATRLDTGPRASLGTFWKQRIAMLPFAKRAGQKPTGRAAAMLLLFAGITLAAPMLSLSLSPAAAPEIALNSEPALDGKAAEETAIAPPPIDLAEEKIEKLPEGMPLEVVPVSGKPNEFMRPIGLAKVTAAPLMLDGVLAADPYRVAHIHPRFPGEVMAIGKTSDKLVGRADRTIERDLHRAIE